VKFFYQIIFLLAVISLYQCTEEKKSKNNPVKTQYNTKTTPTVNRFKEKKIAPTWDSLNRYNTEAFLLAYGKENPETNLIIKTKFGAIKLRLYKDVPVHRANFIFLTKINYFNTTVIYRVAKNFVIQGGNSDNMYTQKQRRKYGNYLLKPEFRKHRKHKFGALAAARQWENNPNKLSSPFEFYMVHKRNGAHHLDNEHTVFGKVTKGFDVIDKIASEPIDKGEWPINDIDIKVSVY
jgi:peptidylprolyl isomerase